MPSGIMPEGATVLPCKSAEQCPWNETAYWEYLDPMTKTRDQNVEKYIAHKAAMDAEKLKLSEATALQAEEEMRNATQQAANIPPEKQKLDIAEHDEKTKLDALADPTPATNAAPTSKPISLQRRQSSPSEDVAKRATNTFADDVARAKSDFKERRKPGVVEPQEKMYMDKTQTTEAELNQLSSGRQSEVPLPEHTPVPGAGGEFPDPLRPLSHKEYVEARIKQELLPPGFVAINAKRYILR